MKSYSNIILTTVKLVGHSVKAAFPFRVKHLKSRCPFSAILLSREFTFDFHGCSSLLKKVIV